MEAVTGTDKPTPKKRPRGLGFAESLAKNLRSMQNDMTPEELLFATGGTPETPPGSANPPTLETPPLPQSSTDGQSERTVQLDSPIGQSKRSVRTDSSNGQSSQTVQTDSSNEQTNWTVQPDTRTVQLDSSTRQMDSPIGQSNSVHGQFNRTVQLDSSIQPGTSQEHEDQTVRLDSPVGQSNRTHQTDSSVGQSDWTDGNMPTELPSRLRVTPLKTPLQRHLASYLMKMGDHVTTYAIISNDTGIAYGSLRNCIRQFTKNGYIDVQKYYGPGNVQGLAIRIISLPSALSTAEQPKSLNSSNGHTGWTVQMDTPSGHTTRPVQMDSPIEQFKRTDQLDCSNPLLDRKKEESKSIYQELRKEGEEQEPPVLSWLRHLTGEEFEMYWPGLAQIGFGCRQIQQALQQLIAQGQAMTDDFAKGLRASLDHADFAVSAPEGLRDRHGTTVANPSGYIYRALARDGYYAAPKGYVSPTAQRAADEAARLVKEAEAEAALQQARRDAAEQKIESELTELLREGETSELYRQLRDSLPELARRGEKDQGAGFVAAMRAALKGYRKN